MEIIKIDIPKGIEKEIGKKIKQGELNRARLFLFGFSAFSVFSFASIYAAGKAFFSAVSATGLSDYLSLLLSDPQSVLGSAMSFITLIAESMPLSETLVAILAVFVFVWTVSRIIKNTDNLLIYKTKLNS